MIVSTPCKYIPIPIATLANTNSTMTILQTFHNYIFAVLRSTSMKHAQGTIFTPFRCTRRLVLTFPHFITETGKQISTYHQSSAVNNDSKSVFCFSYKVLNYSEKSVSRSVLLLSTYMMLERFGDNLTVTTSDIDTLSS